MKKTKVILLILLFVLVIGASTQVKAGSFKEYDNGEVYYNGSAEEFLALSEEEKNSINYLIIAGSEAEEVNFKELHLENMKVLEELQLNFIKISTEEGFEPIPNVKSLHIYNCTNIADLFEKEKWTNLEELDIEMDSDSKSFKTDCEKINNLEKVKSLTLWVQEINDLDDVEELPELHNVEKLKLLFSDIPEQVNLKSVRNISSKFSNLKELGIDNLRISYEDFMVLANAYEKIMGNKITIIKNHEKVSQGKEVLVNIPIEKFWNTSITADGEEGSRLSITEVSNCSYKGGEIKLDTSRAGEKEAIIKIGKYEEFVLHIKYEVEEAEVEESKQEEQTPDIEEVKPSTPEEKPITGTGEEEISGGFLSKIIDTIKNLINSIFEKIKDLFKVKY
ncbi:MAG: hypothetical protein E7310_00605 [Clostridiales bacterium]|nr:hypothetical protein [Clostridiales bacterium]